MNLLPGEQVLREAGSPGSSLSFVLTTHRVRLKYQVLGRGNVVSIMLDQIASCAVTQRSRPGILAFVALFLLAGLARIVQGGNIGPFLVFAIIAGVLAGIYFFTRRQVLELSSAGATLRMNIRGMRAEVVEELIDAVEKAKQARYLLH